MYSYVPWWLRLNGTIMFNIKIILKQEIVKTYHIDIVLLIKTSRWASHLWVDLQHYFKLSLSCSDKSRLSFSSKSYIWWIQWIRGIWMKFFCSSQLSSESPSSEYRPLPHYHYHFKWILTVSMLLLSLSVSFQMNTHRFHRVQRVRLVPANWTRSTSAHGKMVKYSLNYYAPAPPWPKKGVCDDSSATDWKHEARSNCDDCDCY